ncbi:hypothetical protein [Enterococcus sp. AZ126]|uniref:hypothetical protein n=1 Tax=Enterococcus sp. AZ126 TaxID=2774635 RepID=UPI003F1FD81A
MNTKYLSSVSLILIPIIISIIVKLVLNVQFIYILTGIYIIMLFFMIPSDTFFKSSLNYNIKSVNPSYKDDEPKFNEGTKRQFINFILVLSASLICLGISFLSS